LDGLADPKTLDLQVVKARIIDREKREGSTFVNAITGPSSSNKQNNNKKRKRRVERRKENHLALASTARRSVIGTAIVQRSRRRSRISRGVVVPSM